jgi:ribosomal protein L18E
VRSTHRKAPQSDNVYLKLLVKLYRFLARECLIPILILLLYDINQYPRSYLRPAKQPSNLSL